MIFQLIKKKELSVTRGDLGYEWTWNCAQAPNPGAQGQAPGTARRGIPVKLRALS